MQKDSHYYAIYFLCLCAGLSPDESYKIAYSSQYVDDAIDGRMKPVATKKNERPGYLIDPIRTSHNGFESVGVDVQEKIYYPFHFLPGMHGKTFPEMMVTQPGRAGKLFDVVVREALSTGNPFRIGIALHVLADTYAHAGFSGMWSWHNDVSGVNYIPQGKSWIVNFAGKIKWHFMRSIFSAAPPIGHSNAFTFPDIPSMNWKYTDSTGKLQVVSNNIKFAGALLDLYVMVIREYAKKIGLNFRVTETEFRDGEVEKDTIWENVNFPGSISKRCKNWLKHILRFSYLHDLPKHHLHYDSKRWESEVLERYAIGRPDLLRVSPEAFRESNFCKFHEAARDHRAFVLRAVKNPFSYGLQSVSGIMVSDSVIAATERKKIFWTIQTGN